MSISADNAARKYNQCANRYIDSVENGSIKVTAENRRQSELIIGTTNRFHPTKDRLYNAASKNRPYFTFDEKEQKRLGIQILHSSPSIIK